MALPSALQYGVRPPSVETSPPPRPSHRAEENERRDQADDADAGGEQKNGRVAHVNSG
jgi:hypothetical protein